MQHLEAKERMVEGGEVGSRNAFVSRTLVSKKKVHCFNGKEG